MIPITEFPPNPLRQIADGPCMLMSYACAVSALSKVDQQDILNRFYSFIGQRDEPALKILLGLPANASGYDIMEELHKQCVTPTFVEIKNKVELFRVGGDLQRLEEILKTVRATAILALSYPPGRKPHSIAIACDAEHNFFIRDSAQPDGWRNPDLAADATGLSAVEALTKLDVTAVRGEAILFLEKQTQPTESNP